jgi:hypothetical protein
MHPPDKGCPLRRDEVLLIKKLGYGEDGSG